MGYIDNILVAFDYCLFLSISPITFCATFCEQQLLVLLLLPGTHAHNYNQSPHSFHIATNIQNQPEYFYNFFTLGESCHCSHPLILIQHLKSDQLETPVQKKVTI